MIEEKDPEFVEFFWLISEPAFRIEIIPTIGMLSRKLQIKYGFDVIIKKLLLNIKLS